MRSFDGRFDPPCCGCCWGIIRDGYRIEWVCICEYRLEIFREAGLLHDMPPASELEPRQLLLDF